MKAVLASSLKMPTRLAYFLSEFSEETKEALKSFAPFSFYHRDLKKYEVTKEVYEKLSERVDTFVDLSVPVQPFVRKTPGMYGYQQDAVDFSMTHDSLLINFAQGMGKSYTTMKILCAHPDIERTLIVCGQANLQEEWLKDANKHLMTERLNMQIVGGIGDAPSLRKTKWIEALGLSKGVDVINVESLRNDKILNALIQRRYQCIVVDEVQSVKGWKALQTQGLHLIPREEGQMRIALSGTPVLNGPLEYFSVLRFLGLLVDTARTTFERYYGVWSFDFWGHYVCKGLQHLDDLADLLRPAVCAADKSELNLPKKTRKVVRKGLGALTERFSYLSKCYSMTTRKLQKEGFKSKSEVRAKMVMLSGMAEGKIEEVKRLAKIPFTLVFSQYTTILTEYRQLLEADGFRVGYYTGELPMVARLNVLKDWHEGKLDVLLLSVNAARYGLNLTEATQVVFIEPPCSLTVLEQAEDRAHRIGQTKPVESYILSATKIDEEALVSIATKQDNIEQLKEEMQ